MVVIFFFILLNPHRRKAVTDAATSKWPGNNIPVFNKDVTKQKRNLRHWLKSCHLTVPLSQRDLMLKALNNTYWMS